MRVKAIACVGLLGVVLGTPAFATQYPNATCPTPPTVIKIQDPAQTCRPIQPDSVSGVRGIITAFDNNGSGRGFYIQIRTTGGPGGTTQPYTGVDVFTGGFSKPGLALGDSIEVASQGGFPIGTCTVGSTVCPGGAIEEFAGGTEVRGRDALNTTDDINIVRLSGGHTLPNFHTGTLAELREGGSATAEQWEGMLVKVKGRLRVARNNPSGFFPGVGSSMMLVDSACVAGCDSVVIDLSTLSAPVVTASPIGTVFDSVQGIFEERQRQSAPSFRIQIRNGADLFGPIAPNLSDAFFTEDNTIRVIFDRPVTESSAENIDNYGLLTGQVDTAVQPVPNGSEVILTISGQPADGAPQSVTTESIANFPHSTVLSGPQTKSLWQGVMKITDIQAPDPAGLAGNPCEDRSRFAGSGGNPGNRVTFRGTVTRVIGERTYIQDETSGPRSGVEIFRPNTTMTVGRRYRVTTVISEFFGMTNASQPSAGPPFYIVDEGAGSAPAPINITVDTATDTLCDETSPGARLGRANDVLTGEDYEGVLVTIDNVKVVQDNGPGFFFDTIGPPYFAQDTLEVDDDGTWTYDSQINDILIVTGPLVFLFGEFRIQPANDADIVFVNNIGVPPGIPAKVSFGIAPNPGHRSIVSFGLPRKDHVEISVFDLQGRRIATLQKGELEPGNYTREWNGRADGGGPVGSGLYFYRMRVGNEVYRATGVRLD
jgi:hypothetical protein